MTPLRHRLAAIALAMAAIICLPALADATDGRLSGGRGGVR